MRLPDRTRVAWMVVACCVAMVSQPAGAEEAHWSFRPIVRPAIPLVKRVEWVRNPIDAFVLSRLEKLDVGPSPETERTTLIRRATLDLVGLPPSADDVQSFLSDDRSDAYESLVDRLLASPHYGERWTRVWLDLCHYGDTDGHLTDQLRPVAWRYRDWVMRALNSNMPFDEFTMCQLAGDLAANGQTNVATALEQDRVLGTGFLRQTLSNREGGADLEEYRVEQIVDRTSMVGMAWLGLTVGCARCHDHKYDPLSQEEFYKLYAFFDRADEVNIDAPLPHERDAYLQARPQYERRRQEIVKGAGEGLTELWKRWEEKLLHAVGHPGEDHVWDRQWEVLGLIWGGGLGEGQLEGTEIVKLPWDKRLARQQDDLLDYFLTHGAVVDSKRFAELKLADLQSQLTALKKEFSQAQTTRAPVMQTALNVRKTFIHDRGDFRSPGVGVSTGTPDWLPELKIEAASTRSSNPSEATRLDLARWLVSRENPLTARVVANRMWQEFFGRGIVPTSDNFGMRGARPSHPELLDWLADEFMRSGWDVKHMHRLIVTSATYRQSSKPRAELAMVDVDNVFLARQSSLRITAEAVRDSGLAVSGLLSRALGGPSVFPPQSDRVSMEAFGSNNWPVSAGADKYRRGVYTFVQRTSPFAQSITFDAPSPARACTRRDRSNTPLQALTLLNDPVFFEMAEALGTRIRLEGGTTDADKIRFAMQTVLSRAAAETEVQRLQKYLDHERSLKDGKEGDVLEAWCWTKLASVLLNLHEFVTRD